MPLFSLDVQKEFQGEFWTNRYLLELPGMTTTDDAITAIVAAERAITCEDVAFTSWRLSTYAEGDDSFYVQPLDFNGQRTVDQATLLPLFNVIRVDFAVAFQRPNRKYLRGIVVEGDQDTAGVLSSAVIDFINDNYCAYVAALPEYTDKDGNTIISGACFPKVGMRQLRRGSRRRTEPVIPLS